MLCYSNFNMLNSCTNGKYVFEVEFSTAMLVFLFEQGGEQCAESPMMNLSELMN